LKEKKIAAKLFIVEGLNEWSTDVRDFREMRRVVKGCEGCE